MRQIYWVASNNNFNYPLRMHNIEEASRLADEIKGGVYITYAGGQLSLVYSYGESKVNF